MKHRNIYLLLSLLFAGSLPLAGRAQTADTLSSSKVRVVEEVEKSEGHKRAWEIGVGGSLTNWTRISLSGFQRPNENYLFNLKEHHLMGGANLYVARELNRWFYLDLQGTVGIGGKRAQGSARELYYMGGLGLQWRLSPLFKSKYVEPYLRVGANYLHRNFITGYSGSFADDPTGQASWSMSDSWNSGAVQNNKRNFIPVSFGAGLNAWLSNSFGIGIQAEYLMPVEKNLPKFAQVTGRVMWRIGGNDKRTRVKVTKYVQTDRLVEKVQYVREPEKTVAVHDTIISYELLNNIHFDFDKDLTTPKTSEILDRIARILLDNRGEHFLLIGYTDALGSNEYNLELSKRRAKAVYDALLKRGVPASMLKWRGVGRGASLIAPSEKVEVRRGDRKVMIEHVTNMDYWKSL